MWRPDPRWHPLPGGSGASTLGVWRTVIGDRPVVVKRLVRPRPEDPVELSRGRHFAYWRRAADVASYGLVEHTPGMVGSPAHVEEDEDGITLTTDWVEDAANPGLFVARALGRFASAEPPPVDWLARDQLRDRLLRTETRGGWPTLARTSIAGIAGRLWDRRSYYLDLADALPQVLQHGDPTTANLPGRVEGADDDTDDRLVAIDWSCLGLGPVGADLGLYALNARESLEPLLEAYLLGLPTGLADPADVLLTARVSAVYTAVARAEWALARVDAGEGTLEQKYRHPSVAPHLRTLNRQVSAIEALLGE